MAWRSSLMWAPYVPVRERKANAAKAVAALAKKGHPCQPVVIEGRKIAISAWGQAWCAHLEGHADFAYRTGRGRSYVRNGAVIDLHVNGTTIEALVSGSQIYRVKVAFSPLPVARWQLIEQGCQGKVGSLVELLSGRISAEVMAVMTRPGQGLLPEARELEMSCSCPDWATMCKHVAAVLYGIGHRLDSKPELLFSLRGVDPADLIASVTVQVPAQKQGAAPAVADADLADIFGIDIDSDAAAAAPRLPVTEAVARRLELARPAPPPLAPPLPAPAPAARPTRAGPLHKAPEATPTKAPSRKAAAPPAAAPVPARPPLPASGDVLSLEELRALGVTDELLAAWLGERDLVPARAGHYRVKTIGAYRIKLLAEG